MQPLRIPLKDLAQYVGVALLALAFGWWWLSPKRPDAAYINTCQQLYAAASTGADTFRIDGTIPLQQDQPRIEPPTCGALRRAYPKLFQPDSAR